jgi:hypothetical protein
MISSFALAGTASLAWTQGWFWWLVAGEIVAAIVLYSILRLTLIKARWPSME